MTGLKARYLVMAIAISVLCFLQPTYGMQYTLHVLSTSGSTAEAINDNGIVVGANGNNPYRWDTRAGTGFALDSKYGSATAVNELGAAAGYVSDTGSYPIEAFRWSEGVGLERLGLLPEAVFSKAYGINDNGTVVGQSSNASNWSKAFIATGSTIEEIVPPTGWKFTIARDVNNSGVVVGTGSSGTGVIYDLSAGTIFRPSAGSWLAYSANEITDSGIVAGRADDVNHTSSYAYWYDGTLHPTVNLGGLCTEAMGTNDRGDLVGTAFNSSFTQYFFSYVQGQGYHNLSNLGGESVWHLNALNDINNHGQIVGVGQHTNGAGVAVLITPVNFVDSLGDTVTTGGGTTVIGGLEAVFSDIASPGTLLANYTTQTAAELVAQFGSLPGGLSGDESMQLWNVEFSGSLDEAASITFCYNDTALPFDENDISVSHWQEGTGWEMIEGLLNTTANTVTFSTTTFSPFVLTPVPEPSTIVLILVGGTLLTLHLRSRR